VSARRVLHIITELALGGAQRSTLQLLARLDRRRFHPTLLSSDGLLADAARTIADLEVILLPSLRRAIHPFFDAVALGQLTAFIRRRRFDIVHTHSSKAGILGRWAAHLARTPVIVHTIHGFGFHPFQPAPLRLSFQHLERATARITDALIAVSKHDYDLGLRLGIGRPSQYRLIRYGLEAAQVAPNGDRSAVREALHLNGAPVVGTVACLKPQKAPLEFVRACARIRERIPQARFVLIGDGGLRQQVEQEAERLGLGDSLHLLGWRTDVPHLLQAMDVFVLTSRWEGLPIACLEAMAAGLPVVATCAGGLPELLASGEQGVLVPIGQPEQVADGVVALLQDPARRTRIGRCNQQRLTGQFTVEEMVTQTQQLYEELLKEAKPRW
jgi:glycosyltransferase involved in cell wall biosynthesis